MFRYASRCMKRSLMACRVSAPPGWSIQSGSCGQTENDQGATVIVMGPVKVELVGLIQSVWNLNSCSAPAASLYGSIKKLGLPVGGGVPSRSEGNIPPSI